MLGPAKVLTFLCLLIPDVRLHSVGLALRGTWSSSAGWSMHGPTSQHIASLAICSRLKFDVVCLYCISGRECLVQECTSAAERLDV